MVSLESSACVPQFFILLISSYKRPTAAEERVLLQQKNASFCGRCRRSAVTAEGHVLLLQKDACALKKGTFFYCGSQLKQTQFYFCCIKFE